MSVYDFTVTEIDGKEVSLEKYKGKPLLIVNTASKCGLAPQLEGLEKIYQLYKDRGLVVLGFPSNQFLNQEPLGNAEIEEFCQLNYHVTFPLHQKIAVNGDEAHPLYRYLTDETGHKKIKWNYTKFFIDRNGQVIERFAPTTKPEKIEQYLSKVI